MSKGLWGGMKRRDAVLAVLAAGAAPLSALAQASARPMKRIGYLGLGSEQSHVPYRAAFRAGMLEQGLVEGRDYSIDIRLAGGVTQAGPALAAELVASRPDLLLTPGDGSARLLMQNTTSIPIVFAMAMDPVGAGLAAGLRQPSGNATGLTTMATELWPKRLQLLKDAFPRVAHIGVLLTPSIVGSVSQAREIETTALQLGQRVSAFELKQPADIDPAFQRAAGLGIQAWAIPFDAITLSYSRVISDHLIRLKAPSIFTAAEYAQAGGLMSFGASFVDNMRRAAAHVDKIFKGAKPGELPIEQPTRFEMVVNMKTAKAIGVTFNKSFMAGVDRVIE